MKIEIRYETNADKEYICCARTEIQGNGYFGIGRTWDEAKTALLKKLDGLLGQTAPAPETVEVKVAGEEMQTDFDKVMLDQAAGMDALLSKVMGVKQ
jgi:hypothetical protein